MRLGALALSYAVATAALLLVTVLASNLVLSVVAGLDPAQPENARPAAEAVLLSADQETGRAAVERCGRTLDRADGRAKQARERPARCGGQRAPAGGGRP